MVTTTKPLTMPPFPNSSSNGTIGRPSQPTAIKLATGLTIWKGVVSEEYLPDLKPWTKASKIFREMEDDIVIGALYESVIAPLLDSRFTVEAASSDDKDLKAAEFLRLNTFETETFSWREHVRESLEMLSMGFAISEKTLKKRGDGFLWLDDLMPVGQETLHKWGDSLDDHGRVKEFTQQVVTEGVLPQLRTAPIDKLLHFTFNPRKRNPMGRSLSRTLYRAWYFKKNLEVLESIGAERDIGNVPVATLGEGFYSSDDIAKIEEALASLRIDDTGYLIVPHGTEVNAFGAGGKVYDVRAMIRDYQHLIRQRFFMDFISFGSESVGTQALAKEVTGFFSLALGSIQQQMIEVWNRQLVKWLFRWNSSQFSDLTELPKLKWAKPGKINVQSLAQAVQGLFGAGILHYQPEDEHHLREIYELPSITDEEIAAAEAKRQAELKALSQPTTQIEAGKKEPTRSNKRPEDTRKGSIRGGDQAQSIAGTGA